MSCGSSNSQDLDNSVDFIGNPLELESCVDYGRIDRQLESQEFKSDTTRRPYLNPLECSIARLVMQMAYTVYAFVFVSNVATNLPVSIKSKTSHVTLVTSL